MTTLEEAMTSGQGIERPFRCEVHDDSQASASVNVLKGVWFCHACHASGKVGDKKAPKPEELLAMLEPEKAARVYPEAWLELFTIAPDDDEAYWRQRFTPWVIWSMGLGQDPFSGSATFPVYTPGGKLAGVGKRFVDEEGNKRYMYPRGWSAAMQVGGTRGRTTATPVVCITEGYADATSVWEVGCAAVAQWGSQLHKPQIEMIARMAPKLILLGQDMDEAGERGVSMAFKQLHRIAPLKRVYWPRKDPAASSAGHRLEALEKAVSAADYGVEVLPQWNRVTAGFRSAYGKAMEEAGYG